MLQDITYRFSTLNRLTVTICVVGWSVALHGRYRMVQKVSLCIFLSNNDAKYLKYKVIFNDRVSHNYRNVYTIYNIL